MKKITIFLLLIDIFLGMAQMPISESNSFQYTKQNYGADIYNAFRYIYEDESGKIIVAPLYKPYLQISNTYTSQFLKDKDINSYLELAFKLKGKTFLIASPNKFYEVLPDRNVKELNLNIKNDIGFTILHNGKVWFVDGNKENKQICINVFDGEKKTTIDTFYPACDLSFVGFTKYQKDLLVYTSNPKENTTQIFKIENQKLVLLKTYPFYCNYLYYENPEKIVFAKNESSKVFLYNQGKINNIYECSINNVFLNPNGNPCVLENNFLNIMNFKNGKPEILANIYNIPLMANCHYSKETNSYYLGSGNGFYRLFPYVKKYPRVFDHSNSQTIYSLVQGKDGKIWAGNYNGKLAFIDKDKITQSPLKYSYMNAALKVGNKIVLGVEYQKGILLFDDEKHYRKIHETATSYQNFISKDSVFYSGDANLGLIYANWKDIIKGKPQWKTIGYKVGNPFKGFDGFAEDKFGNIWASQFRRGFMVLNPKTGKITTLETEKKQIPFGAVTILLDNHKTMWIATNKGKLFYYDDKNKNEVSPKNFVEIKHPLFEAENYITFIHQWKNFLVLGAYDKILLFDLEKWYKERKVSVRYLNPMETNFTINTENHTVLTDFRDESIWFSTTDMLYQWNIKDWLKLPTFKANPEIVFTKDSIENHIHENQKIIFKPRENTFEIDVRYQTKDNMPRYISADLAKENEKPDFEAPNLTTHFKFQNLRSGNYIFYARICQQDGSFTTHKFFIKIQRFIWQQWWFWFLMSLFPMFFIWYYLLNKKEKEQRKKEIAQLNVATLSSQFRPHFMLNALNSLGTELIDKPHAEKVISRIGDNINRMYSYSQNRKFYIPFEDEWKLVENTIEIQKIIFIKKLETSIKKLEIIPKNYQIPMGILQVCVENALLHGIRHRKIEPYFLEINFKENATQYIVEITDNGVGRKNSAKIYNFKRNGTGLKNIDSLIKIVNSEIPDAIQLNIEDHIFSDKKYPGTKVIIKLLKKIDYEKFKL